MATRKQRKAIDEMVVNGGIVSQAMLAADYSPATAKTPQKLTESKGFKELMEEYGLTEGFITKALVSDIDAKPRRRFLELNLGAEILGMKKKLESNAPAVVILNISNQVVQKYQPHEPHETTGGGNQ